MLTLLLILHEGCTELVQQSPLDTQGQLSVYPEALQGMHFGPQGNKELMSVSHLSTSESPV